MQKIKGTHHKGLWSAGFAVTVVIVAIALYFMFTYKLDVTLPEFTVETLLIMMVMSFPASYTGRWVADYFMHQDTHLGMVFKETTIGIIAHWSIYLPMLMIYNYVVFGRIMSFPSFEQLKNIGLFSVGSVIVIPSLLHKIKRKKWYEQIGIEDMEE